MRRMFYAAAAASFLAAACGSAAADRGAAARTESGLRCAIETTRTANGIALRGIARSASPRHGEFSLTIKTFGSAGGSDIVQSGAFDTIHGPAILGESEFSLSRGQKLRASLEVRDAAGRVCRDEIRR